MSKVKPIVIVQGAQFGSEAKGMTALGLCEERGVEFAVRTGSINAGHTVIVNGKKMAFQQLPVAAVLPRVKCVIGPGAYVHPKTLIDEIRMSGIDPGNVIVDRNCGIHLDDHQDEAKEAGRNLKIGATGKGCAEAIIHKIRDRGVGKSLLLRDRWDGVASRDFYVPLIAFDTAGMLNDVYDDGKSILIEGTQGALLDFHTGPYPFVTSRQTLAASWVSEAGLSPALDYEIALVARTYPIRVAGVSGPMGEEIDWPTLARRINSRLISCGLEPMISDAALLQFQARMREAALLYATDAEQRLLSSTMALASMDAEYRDEVMRLFETTTVTKRLRRIAELDLCQLRDTVHKERPAYLVLTFLNYVFPELAPTYNPGRLIHGEAMAYVRRVEQETGARVQYVSVGPASKDLIRLC